MAFSQDPEFRASLEAAQIRRNATARQAAEAAIAAAQKAGQERAHRSAMERDAGRVIRIGAEAAKLATRRGVRHDIQHQPYSWSKRKSTFVPDGSSIACWTLIPGKMHPRDTEGFEGRGPSLVLQQSGILSSLGNFGFAGYPTPSELIGGMGYNKLEFSLQEIEAGLADFVLPLIK